MGSDNLKKDKNCVKKKERVRHLPAHRHRWRLKMTMKNDRSNVAFSRHCGRHQPGFPFILRS